MIVRKCEDKDIDKIVDIERKSFSNPYPHKVFLNFLGSDLFLVAEKEEVIGYILGEEMGDEGWIISIAVLPEHRSQGIGTTLMREIIGRMETDEVLLTLRTNNMMAYKFYMKLGFSAEGFIKSYYENGDDAILMKKEL